MSAIVLNRELTYRGRRYAITPIRRRVVRVDENGAIPDEHIGTNGFRREYNFQTSDTWDAESLMQTGDGGGLIVGEGDTGKTWFTEQLEQADDGDAVHVSVIKLRGYLNDASKLIDVADRFWSAHGEGTGCANLVLDGLDENPNAGPVIIRICHGLPDDVRCRVWVTSRMCGSMREILASGALKHRYGLLPLDEDEIETLAENVHEDGAAFLAAIKQRRVAMFAAKPGGATNLLSLYGDGKIQNASRQDLIRSIALKFVHESRDGVEKSANELRFDDDKLLDASAWIATRLLFARKNRIWNSGETSCPPDALHYDELLSARNYPRDLMNVATGSRLFEPLDDYSLRFTCDETLMPFLAAHWICTHVPRENIPNLIKTDNGVGKTVATVFNWLGLLDPLVVQQWIKVHPVAFLGCREAVEFFGVDKYYRLLESQLIAMSSSDSSQTLRDSAACLEGDAALTEIALARLVAGKRPLREVILAAEVLKFTRVKTDKSIDLIADYLMQHWNELSIENRKDFAFALETIVADDKCHHAVLSQFKPVLLSTEPTNTLNDSLRGVLLEILWPRYLSDKELVSALRPRMSQADYDSYTIFLEESLPQSFEECFDASNIDLLLDWTLKTGIDTQYVFTHAWKWAEIPTVAEKLNAILTKCSKHYFDMPFLTACEQHHLDSKGKCWRTDAEDCEQYHARRFAILNAAIHDNTWRAQMFAQMFARTGSLGLYYESDFADLYDWWCRIKDDARETSAADCLSIALETLSYRLPLDRYTTERQVLLARHPNKMNFDIDVLKTAHEKYEKEESEFNTEEKKRNEARNAAETQHREAFQKHILTSEMTPEFFINLAHWLDSSTAQATKPKFDARKTCQWGKLGKDAQSKVYQAAVESVKSYAPEFPDMTQGMAFCSAMHLVWCDKIHSAKKLPSSRWEEIVRIMTEAAFVRYDMEKCEAMVLWGYAHYPEACEEGFYQTVVRELCSKECYSSILGIWDRLITDSLLERLIQRFGNDAPHMVAILKEICQETLRRGERFPSVETYLRTRFVDTNITALSDDAMLMALATVFCPNDFIPFIIECTQRNGDTVKQWLDAVMKRFHECVAFGFYKVDMKSAAQFYLWMDKAYPPEKMPQHGMTYTPQSIDEIYVLKSSLADRLLTAPTKEALEVFDAALAKEKNDRLSDMRKRMAHVMEELLPPELASADVLTKIAALERPIGQMTVKEYNKLVKELNKDLATKTDLSEIFGKSIEDIKKQLLIVKEITLGGLERLQKRSQQKQKRVNAVIDKYYELIKNGTKKREALTDACNEIEKSMGLAGFKLSGLRNAADRAIKKCERKYGDEAPVRYREEHPLPE